MAVTPMIFFWALLPPLGFFSIFLMAFLWPYLLMYFFPSTKSRKNFCFRLRQFYSNINLYNIYYVRIYNYRTSPSDKTCRQY